MSEDINNERRLKLVSISEKDVLLLFNARHLGESGHVDLLFKDHSIAPEWKAVGCFTDYTSRCLMLVVHHQSFPVVPDGEQIPRFPVNEACFVSVPWRKYMASMAMAEGGE